VVDAEINTFDVKITAIVEVIYERGLVCC